MRIRPDEASGVLHPQNLVRYAARWIDPDPAVRDVVDTYWHVRWQLDESEVVDQTIVDLPAVTLTVETGDVPAGLVVTGLHRRAWHRRIAGSGDVFAVRLRPAGLAVLGTLRPQDLADATVPLAAGVDDGLRTLLAGIAAASTPQDRARAADTLVADRLREHPPSDVHLLANAVLDELRSRAYRRTGTPLAEHFAVSERTIQRALSATLGIGPKQAARRIRLQEVARAIAVHGDDDLAGIAVQLGYADQAHLTSDFRASTGLTPGAYRRQLQRQSGNAL
ncbi:AraC family transcriptional regulator [Cellulomonas terrae]|uniref:AraC family transcriptional regulator n=1 Tax=Cellulomonas terrae TaxID=311234 RepID=A0A511JNN5_9CELL|nr:helix-turn-helix domain-containing protein [Cellulomonas terrae]GEL99465.1 AraC family transcriptional regulator [Cellulomonas terrae]